MDFRDALFELLFGDSGQLTAYKGPKMLVFAVGSTLMAFIVILLDRILYSVRRRSMFELRYEDNPIDTVRLVLLWSLGAGLGGLLGSGANIVQMTRFACITVGIGWPLIFGRLIDAAKGKEDDQEPEQPS